MRSLSILVWVALGVGLATGCGSSAKGSDGGAAASGATTCSPACGGGSVCVGTGTEGGAVIFPDDAGVCPSGTHLAGSSCQRDLSYACMPIPFACGGAVTCACASTLCPSGHICEAPGGDFLNCIEAVP